MCDEKPEVGAITWFDLIVPNAEEVRDFYNKVVGWKPSPVSMGDYDDFNMNAPGSGKAIAGVCHARGGNADLPPQWFIYVESGGKIITSPKDMGGYGRYCVIQDPAGAIAGWFAYKS